MITHPTAAELRQALADVETGPPGDARAAFIARVADNARATLDREAALGPAAEAAAVERLRALLGRDGGFEALNAELCARLRDGRLAPLDPTVLAHLKASLLDHVAIDQPSYWGLAAAGGS
jgi:AcrR family transcriptional regulator